MDNNLLIAARAEYTDQLQDILSNGIFQEMKSIWLECKNETKNNVLQLFQKKLCLIPIWNQEVINKKCEASIKDFKGNKEYLDKIIEAVFLSNVKILSVVKLNEKRKTIDVSVPDTKNFIHRCYIESARSFYIDPYLVDDRETGGNTNQEIQRNLKRCQKTIKDSIEKTIRGMIPMEEILNKYLESASSDEEECNVSTSAEHSGSVTQEENTKEESFSDDVPAYPEIKEEYIVEKDSEEDDIDEECDDEEYEDTKVDEIQEVLPSLDDTFNSRPDENILTEPVPQIFDHGINEQEKLRVRLKTDNDKNFFSDSE